MWLSKPCSCSVNVLVLILIAIHYTYPCSVLCKQLSNKVKLYYRFGPINKELNAYPVVNYGFCLAVNLQRLKEGEYVLVTLFDVRQSRSRHRLPLLRASIHP